MRITVAYEVSAFIDDKEIRHHYYFADRCECISFLCRYYPRLLELHVQRLMVDTLLHDICYEEITFNYALRSFC